MSGPTLTSARQIVSRDTLQEIFPNVPGQLLDLILRSIDRDLTVPLRADASASPNLTISIGPAIVDNAISHRQKSIPHVNGVIPTFTAGSITLPSSDGGTITVSPGSSLTLNCPFNQFNKILVSLDSTGNLVLTEGTPAGTAAGVAVPSPVSNTIPICYFVVSNVAGTIQPIVQNQIFQIAAGGGGSGGAPQAGYAQEVAIPAGATSQVITFTALPGVNYFPQVNFVNLLDTDPQFQSFTITAKTTSSFTVKWNAPTDSGNYLLSYIIPTVQLLTAEVAIPSGATTVTATLPMDQGGTNYSVVGCLVDLADADPQFQSVVIIGKTNTTVTFSVNAPTENGNYKIDYQLASYQ